jgi:hypothetical protein
LAAIRQEFQAWRTSLFRTDGDSLVTSGDPKINPVMRGVDKKLPNLK